MKTDYLLKENLDDIEYTNDTVEQLGNKRLITAEDANEFIDEYKIYSKKLADSVSLFILAPAFLLLASILSTVSKNLSENVFYGIGVAVLLILIAYGVYKIIVSSQKVEKYNFIEEGNIELSYGVKGIVEKLSSEGEEKYTKSIAASIVIYIVGVVLVVLAGFINNDVWIHVSVIALLVLCSIATNIIVRKSTVRSTYDMLLQQGDYSAENKIKNKKQSSFSTAYWLIVIAIYLGVSLYTNKWGTTWIIFAVAAILFAALNAIFKSRNDNK